jgi:hypothetical protein
MGKTIKIISTKKIEIVRDLAYVDRTPDLARVGAIVSSDALIRVNVLRPISYQFEVGTNEIPEPLDAFQDPVKREMITKESILDWKGVQHLIEAGVFEAYKSGDIVKSNSGGTKKKATKKPKSLDEVAKEEKE